MNLTIPRRAINKLCVFCGSSLGNQPIYQRTTANLGRRIVSAGLTLVYGGARIGLMGVLADSVLAAGGEAIGVIPKPLVEKEQAHTGLTHLHIVNSMHERKALMADLSDAFLLLPGGLGSWEEFCEIVTWAIMGIHQKPCGILNVAGYYDSLVSLSSHAVTEGFLQAPDQELIIVSDDLEQLFSRLSPVSTTLRAKSLSSDQR